MIGIVCALKCEAEDLIKHFELKALLQKSIFPIYGNGIIFLIICGIGKMQAAAAVTYLYAIGGERSFTAWINIGVGGHASHNIGEGFCAHQVIDQGSFRKYYPVFTWKERLFATETIYTVDTVEKTFEDRGIYEMEAAGFCASAFCLTTAELIHCFKIVSDNLEQKPVKDPVFVKGLIKKHLSSIETLIGRLQTIQNELNKWNSVSRLIHSFIERWHFTQTELFQLQRCLQRWEAVYPNESLFDERLSSCKKAKEVLTYLSQKLCFL